MVKCNDCGYENESGRDFCSNCGAKLGGSSSNKKEHRLRSDKESGPHTSFYDFSASSGSKGKSSILKGKSNSLKGKSAKKRNKLAIIIIFLIILSISFLIVSHGIGSSGIGDYPIAIDNTSSAENNSILDNDTFIGDSSSRNGSSNYDALGENSSSGSNYLKCPYCGSESVYESSGYYRCENCGEKFSNPDNLEINSDASYSNCFRSFNRI